MFGGILSENPGEFTDAVVLLEQQFKALVMEKRRQLSFKPLESGQSDQPILRAVDQQDEEQLPSICIALHHARRRAGYELTDVAKALRIQLSHLQALEDGRFEDLPGETYAVGFLKSYGGFLGLDTEDLVARYKTETGAISAKQRLEFPVPSKESRMPRPWLVLLALALAGVAYGGWQYYSTEGQIATDIVADVSEKFTDPSASGSIATAPAAIEPVEAEPAASDAPVAVENQTVAPETLASVVEEDTPEISAPEIAILENESVEGDIGGLSENLLTEEPTPAPAMSEMTSDSVSTAALAPETAASETSASVQPETNLVVEPPEDSAPLMPATVELPAADESALASSAATDSSSFSSATVDDFTSTNLLDQTAAPDLSRTSDIPAARDENTLSAEVAAPEVPETPSEQSAWFEPRIDYQFAPVEPASETPSMAGPRVSRDTDLSATDVAAAEPDSSQFSVAYVPRVYGRTNQSGRVTITATADSWVQVQGPDSELLLTRILRTGDSYYVPNRPDLIMVTGNAGALEIRVDGSLVDPVGPVGVVRRNVALDPGRLLEGTAVEN